MDVFRTEKYYTHHPILLPTSSNKSGKMIQRVILLAGENHKILCKMIPILIPKYDDTRTLSAATRYTIILKIFSNLTRAVTFSKSLSRSQRAQFLNGLDSNHFYPI